MKETLVYFRSVFSKEQVKDKFDDLIEFGKDRTNQFKINPQLILFPKSTDDIVIILKYCNENNISVVPSGGRTGLSGGAVASRNEIIISMEKMNRIIEIDTIGSTIEMDAGCILQDVQDALIQKELLFPIDFAAKGSAQIGGCVSTNAGGIKVVKYGMTRNNVLGLEIVLANGEILDLNRKLIKDNSGYDLRQLFIGAEGTLGIITKVSFSCVAIPEKLYIGLFACKDFDSVPKILSLLRESGLDLTAFEFFSEMAIKLVLEYSDLKNPFEDNFPFYALIEINEKKEDELFFLMENLADAGLISDGTLGSSPREVVELWALRERISESISMFNCVHKNDVSVPVKQLACFIPELEHLIRSKYQNYELVLFGHIADGNIHINIIDRCEKNAPDFIEKMKKLDKDMFSLIAKNEGSISAEHGIGLMKKEGIKYCRTLEEIKLMKSIKQIFDPKNIMNPLKIFD